MFRGDGSICRPAERAPAHRNEPGVNFDRQDALGEAGVTEARGDRRDVEARRVDDPQYQRQWTTEQHQPCTERPPARHTPEVESGDNELRHRRDEQQKGGCQMEDQ